MATADLTSAAGLPSGTAAVSSRRGGLLVSIAASGLTPGAHGVHLHATGRCDGPAFTTAGSHLNPFDAKHGSLNPDGTHLGDIPNLTVGRDGAGAVTFALPGSSAANEAALFDADGTAIVIHADPDDYRTDPSGSSGARIACGVLRRS